MPAVPMFPLGTVLFPHMPLRLRVFEQRYLVMLDNLLKADSAIFGVVLIERGREVGGGEQRFRHGTLAEITSVGSQEGFVGLVAEGRVRFEVLDWLPEQPHPRAEIREIPELVWSDTLAPLLAEVEQAVRRGLALASEFSEHTWPADVELSSDPVAVAWQLAGIAPLGPLDQLTLLQSDTVEALLRRTIELVKAASEAIEAPWSGPDAG